MRRELNNWTQSLAMVFRIYPIARNSTLYRYLQLTLEKKAADRAMTNMTDIVKQRVSLRTGRRIPLHSTIV